MPSSHGQPNLSTAAAGARAVVTQLSDAINRGDLDAAVACYEPGAVLIPQPGTQAHGLDQVREALRGFIALQPTLVTTRAQLLESGDLVLYFGWWQLTGASPDGAAITMSGVSTDVLRRQTDGRWLVVIDNPWGTA